MDKGHIKKRKSEKSNRSRKNQQETTYRIGCQKEVIKKAQTMPLSNRDLIFLAAKVPNFVGIYASDELASLRILGESVFFIVNLDIATKSGSHWIAIRLGRKNVEIFDSLGFSYELWGQYPEHLLSFLRRYRRSHRFYISPVLQPPETLTCGLYCIYFIFYRQKLSFTACVSKFSSDLTSNNSRLFSFLNKIF